MAVYVQLQKQDLQGIADNYGLDVVGFEPIEGGACNSNYLLHTQQGKYVLTIFDEKPLVDVVKIGELLLFLAKNDFPTTRLLCQVNGNPVTMYMDRPVILKTYIAGRVFKDLDGTMLDQVGRAMGRLHLVAAPIYLPDEHPYGLQVFSSAIGRDIDPRYESWLADRLGHLKRHIPPNLPRGLVHGDVFYDNVLFDSNGFSAIIDFEEACFYYKVFDLGMGVLGLCTEGADVLLDKVKALIAGYQQVRALEKREKGALQLFVEYAAVATSYWRFWKYRIHAPDEGKADRHWQMVGIAEQVSAIPGATFLEAVFD